MRMKTAFISYFGPGENGVGTTAFDQATALSRLGGEVVLFTEESRAARLGGAEFDVVGVRSKPTARSLAWSALRRLGLSEAVTALDVDLVKFAAAAAEALGGYGGSSFGRYVFTESFMEGMFWETPPGAKTAMRFGCPRYLFQRLGLSDRSVNRRLDELDRAAAGRADIRFAPSRRMAELAGEYYGVDAEGISVVANPVDTERFRPPAERGEGFNLLFVGRFTPEKGSDVICEIAPTLLEEYGDFRLTLAGPSGVDGDGVEYARKLVESVDEGHRGRIDVLGEVGYAGMFEVYGGAHAVILPSRFESFGRVVAEAQAAGLPAVVSSAGALPELVDAERGFVVAGEGGAEYLEAVRRLVEDRAVREAMGKRAREHAEGNYSYASVGARLEEILGLRG